MSSHASYEVLTVATVPTYIRSRPALARLVDTATLSVREVGDGNLNLVFVCRDAKGRGLCLKQALPYVRIVGESWPLTPARSAAEARSLDAALSACPELVPGFHGFDPKRFVIAMENLSEWTVWRAALNAGEIHRGVAGTMGEYVARMCFATSLFGLQPEAAHLRAAEAVNPELCRITEDVVFTEPYLEHEHNSYASGIASEVERLQRDERLVAEVGALKYRFMTDGQALIHGDLHTGSIMVRREEADRGSAKVIDGEFCFYGPVGFDLGALAGNYLLAYARGLALRRPAGFLSWVEGLPRETWDAFCAALRALWPSRAERFLSDGFLESWLEGVWHDAVGYAGCKAIRRIIGLAKVSDIQTLPPEEHRWAAAVVLRTASRWIAERNAIGTPDGLLAIARETAMDLER